MSNGVDSLANGNNKDLNDLVSSTPEATYSGQNFAGSLNTVSVNDMKGSENYSVPVTVTNNVDSINTLGASTAPMNIQSSQRN